jgi:two-component system NtrC family sensor kinase
MAPGPVSSFARMKKDSQMRFVAVLLAVLTVTAGVFGWINFQKERQFETPDDGVLWLEAGDHLEARRVDPGGPGARAGIKTGDELLAVNDHEVKTVAGLTRQMYRTGTWSKATYSVRRDGVSLQVPVILVPFDKSLYMVDRFIALIYLGIGLYVLLRRWTAPKSTHFYIFCLVSYILYAFHYTSKLNAFDSVVYWANVVAGLLQPALFLHFVLTFPEVKESVKRRPWLAAACYLPGALLLAWHIFAVRALEASGLLRYNIDRVEYGYLAAMFMVAAGVLWHSYKHASTPILRQQMKWVTRGTLIAIVPFTLFYVIPFLRGTQSVPLMKVAVLSLVFLPLTFGYAIFRYRLMDVDVIFKRGMAYTLAAASIAGVYFAAIGIVLEIVHKRLPDTGNVGMIVAIIITALLFDPIKNWIQERIDRFFYRKRYDYRKTLIEFGRELSSQLDLEKMLSSIVDRISRTLLVDRMAIFLAEPEAPDNFVLAKSFGIADTGGLDLGFLGQPRPEMEAGHLFFDNTHAVVRETPGAQATIAKLDMNYFIPCSVQGRTIAVIGLGKTSEGDFLSSEDVELLEAIAGYIGIAVQNARLYDSLEQKVQEYERLKDFNENIVESISVGVFAVDLQDRIEFWNSQMETMYALARSQAVGHKLSEVFPSAFAEEYYRVRGNPGIHNLYKFRLQTAAGETRTANVAIAPLVTRNFAVIGRLLLVDDITERIELESQLSQAEKLSSIGLLAAGVAHEVNTPLAVISSYAQMLSKQLLGDEKRSGLLDKIIKQTFRASEIVNNLLNFSRTSGTEFGEVDVNKVIRETLALLEHQFKVSRVKVEEDISELPMIHGNTGKLQQVFLNLFLNAKDAMPSGGTLRVATHNGGGVNVTITDSGSGIAQEHIDRIYDPFFTTKTTPRDGRRGTGLGLSVTYGIIQEHAGKIRVESKLGVGTTFYLEFPLMRKAVNV